MNRPQLVLLAIVVLGFSASGVIREVVSRHNTTESVSLSDVGTGDGTLRFTRVNAGPQLPAIRFVDGTGAQRSLADFRGRVILLNVWATWCGPCRAEMPALNRLQQKLGSPAFEVVALSIDSGGVSAVKGFYEELNLHALQIYVDASGEATSALSTVGIPTTLLVDQDGREIWRVIGAATWDKAEVIDHIRRYLAPDGTVKP